MGITLLIPEQGVEVLAIAVALNAIAGLVSCVIIACYLRNNRTGPKTIPSVS